MTSSGKQTMSAPRSRARPIQSMTRRVLPSRSPTIGLTCASAARSDCPTYSILTASARECPAPETLALACVNYFDRLRALSAERNTLLCVGLDPDPERIGGGAAGALRHCQEVVRQTEEHVCCYKPNSAFWEQYGPDGWTALMELRDEAPDTPFLFDGKRGDMGNTMQAYARAVFETLAMDATTVNPYLGSDSIEEFTRYADRGVYVVCRSSNPGAADLQHLVAEGRPLYMHVAALADRLNTAGNVGLVVGATAPDQIVEVRRATELPFLIPGVGAQGGDVEGSVRGAWHGDRASTLVSSSRSVMYAKSPAHEAEALKRQINAAAGARRWANASTPPGWASP